MRDMREPDAPDEVFEPYLSASLAVVARISQDRGRMTRDDARDVLRLEWERRGIKVTAGALRFADRIYDGPFWMIRHPWELFRRRRT